MARRPARNDLYCVEWGVKLYSLTHSNFARAALTEFIVALCVTARVFAVTLPLCRELQRETLDLAAALEMATQVKTVIGDMRASSEVEFKVIFDTAGAFCADSGVETAVPRLAKRLTKRCNVTADSPEAYYCAAVFVPFLDNFLMQLHDKFLSYNQLLKSFSCLLPSRGSV